MGWHRPVPSPGPRCPGEGLEPNYVAYQYCVKDFSLCAPAGENVSPRSKPFFLATLSMKKQRSKAQTVRKTQVYILGGSLPFSGLPLHGHRTQVDEMAFQVSSYNLCFNRGEAYLSCSLDK